jgi:hypothetical protein
VLESIVREHFNAALRLLGPGCRVPDIDLRRSRLGPGVEPALRQRPVGDPAAGDMPAGGEAGVSSSSTASQPAPFGGPWNSRPKLTGDWGGLREQLRDHGFTFDISATTYYQGIASGGLKDTFRFGGRNDYLLNVDGQKAGLWEGLGINLHGETVYGDSVNLLTGAVAPVNIGRSLPVPVGTVSALTAVKFTQALSENFILYAGKINTVDNVQQPFMLGRVRICHRLDGLYESMEWRYGHMILSSEGIIEQDDERHNEANQSSKQRHHSQMHP